MHYIFNHSWIVEVLLPLPGAELVMVAVLLGVLGEVTLPVAAPGGGNGGGKCPPS